MSRAAVHSPHSATSTSASPSSRSRRGSRSRREVKMYPFCPSRARPSRQSAARMRSPGRAFAARSGRRAMPVQEADSAAG